MRVIHEEVQFFEWTDNKFFDGKRWRKKRRKNCIIIIIIIIISIIIIWIIMMSTRISLISPCMKRRSFIRVARTADSLPCCYGRANGGIVNEIRVFSTRRHNAMKGTGGSQLGLHKEDSPCVGES
eukprot:TRINITY_DN1226_c0_g2_i2.p1 TRINITY_DN1226_c0_g2~~TRINITY_DN1226_c0_g2_i2.p1  ORF type:complete len:125 (+),score=13.10 TRINITY_DN1226_c0_g2_i2:277-651(+)